MIIIINTIYTYRLFTLGTEALLAVEAVDVELVSLIDEAIGALWGGGGVTACVLFRYERCSTVAGQRC